MPLSKAEIERVVARDHPDPHHVLGAHPARSGVRIRAFRPDAEAVVVHADGAPAVELHRIHPDGLFEGVATGAKLPLRVGRAPSEFTSMGRGGACRPEL